jgi:hypothetical protein
LPLAQEPQVRGETLLGVVGDSELIVVGHSDTLHP